MPTVEDLPRIVLDGPLKVALELSDDRVPIAILLVAYHERVVPLALLQARSALASPDVDIVRLAGFVADHLGLGAEEVVYLAIVARVAFGRAMLTFPHPAIFTNSANPANRCTVFRIGIGESRVSGLRIVH